MKQKFQDINIRKAGLEMIVKINTIIADYARQGYRLTLRQLYYQLVSKDLIPNSQQSYKRIGGLWLAPPIRSCVADARLNLSPARAFCSQSSVHTPTNTCLPNRFASAIAAYCKSSISNKSTRAVFRYSLTCATEPRTCPAR